MAAANMQEIVMPHTKELEDILALEQHNIVPKVIKRLKDDQLGISKHRAEILMEKVATESPTEVADDIAIGLNPENLPPDSYHTYMAAAELHRGSYWHALPHIEKISDEKKETREHLGKIAIEQCFDPINYCHSLRSGNKIIHAPEPNKYGAHELIRSVISNPNSKLKHLISVQELEKCINNAFIEFVNDPKAFVYRQSLSLGLNEDAQESVNWLYRSFCNFLERAQFLDKNIVLKTIENKPDFEPGWAAYLYLNYIFKRFEGETTPIEKAKMFWPVLKDILWPREQYDVLEEDEKVLNEYIKHARHPYCKERTEKEFKEIMTKYNEDNWQSLDFAHKILGKKRVVELIEETARGMQNEEEAENLIRVITDESHYFDKYVNLATVYVLKSHCVPREDDHDYDLKRKNEYMTDLDKMERRLGTVPRGNPAWDDI